MITFKKHRHEFKFFHAQDRRVYDSGRDPSDPTILPSKRSTLITSGCKCGEFKQQEVGGNIADELNEKYQTDDVDDLFNKIHQETE